MQHSCEFDERLKECHKVFDCHAKPHASMRGLLGLKDFANTGAFVGFLLEVAGDKFKH